MPIIRVAIAGATGYTGEELLRLLLQHPHVQLTYLAASAKWDRPVLASDVFPRLTAPRALAVESLDPSTLIDRSDAVFLALPHGTAMTLAPSLLAAGKRVIDLSGDFRLRDPALYPQWYHLPHAQPQLLHEKTTVYGLTEWYREQIPSARLIANPGCYATSILLAALPLFRAKAVEQDQFIIDAKSGLTGAGRKPDTALLFTEMAENLRAYKVNQHQHMPEVVQAIQQLTGRAARLTFVPQMIPVARGLISMMYARTPKPFPEIVEAYRAAYPADRAPFVRLRVGRLPQLSDVVGTNYCDIGLADDAANEQVIIASALDNLTKGAAGQAVQNFNLMYGFPETTSLV